MPKALRLASCLVVALAVVVSGCGSTKKSTNKAASTNANTSASGNEGSQTSQSTSSKEARHARKAREPNAAEAKRERRARAAKAKRERREKAAKAKRERGEKAAEAKRERELFAKRRRQHFRELEARRLVEQQTAERSGEPRKPRIEAAERRVSLLQRYPKEIVRNFIAGCEAAKGSTSSCECVDAKLQTSKVERGQSIAELMALEFAMKNGMSFQQATLPGAALPRAVHRDVRQCKNARK